MKIRLKNLLGILAALLLAFNAYAQEKGNDALSHEVIYKTVSDSVNLKMRFHYPEGLNKKKKYPAIVFYFGGGWNGGTITQFEDQAKYFASRGMIGVLVDYRVKSRHKTTPYESVKDAKSAIRFLKKNAKELNIDPHKIVASGGSAGGHLAAAVPLATKINESTDDLAINTEVSALILYNPVVDNGPGPNGFQHEHMGKKWAEISPSDNIIKGAPPTLFLLGDQDHLIPVAVADDFKQKMNAVGSRCDVFIYKGQGHGFFNRGRQEDDKYYLETTRQADLFLKSLGFIKGKPKI